MTYIFSNSIYRLELIVKEIENINVGYIFNLEENCNNLYCIKNGNDEYLVENVDYGLTNNNYTITFLKEFEKVKIIYNCIIV